MTTVIIENIDKITYPSLPPIITTDSQGTYHKNTTALTKLLAWLCLCPKDSVDNAWCKIYEVSGGWITGSGCGGVMRDFAGAMQVDIWDKPVWDYSSDVYYASRLGQVYNAVYGNEEDCYHKQGWIWERVEGGFDVARISGSGLIYAAEAFANKFTTSESIIKYAAIYDPFTNDVVQCNIDFREELNRKGELKGD